MEITRNAISSIGVFMTLTSQILPSSNEAYDMFASSRAYVQNLAPPRYATYVVRVSVRDGNTWKTRSYDSLYDAGTNDVLATSISREEAARPADPRGADLFIGTPFGRLRINKPMDDPDFLGGSPQLAPRYFFGLERAPTAAASISTHPEVTETLPVIGRVSAASRLYDVSFIAEETLSNRPCWHLGLRPIRDPSRHRVREMWVDREDSIPLRIVTEGAFDKAWTSHARWTSEYQLIDGKPYLAREWTDDALHVPGGKVFGGASVSFEELSLGTNPGRLRILFKRRTPILAEPP